MPKNISKQDSASSLCGQLHDDDGVDPRYFFRQKRKRSASDRKTLQLCRQVMQTLSFELPGDGRDKILERLHVISVTPAPNASQLLVAVYADVPQEDYDPKLIQQRLEQEEPRLRCEVAAAITRRKTPRLLFELIGPAERRS